MPRARSPNRNKAYEIWKEHNGNITNRKIAEMLGEKEKTISNWKSRDKWTLENVVLHSFDCSTTKNEKRKRGAPKGSKNALGNKGGAAPKGNQNAVKHGFFRRIFPDDEETHSIIEEIGVKKPLEILWENIVIQYTAIVRAQKIMFVKDQDDITRVLKRRKSKSFSNKNGSSEEEEEEYEIVFAEEKQANFLQAQSRAMATLQKLLEHYESMATDEQKLKIEKMKADIDKIKKPQNDTPIEIIIKRKGEDS